MNFEELQDPKLRRQASGYCAWLDAIDRQKKLIAEYERDLARFREGLLKLQNMSQEERLAFDAPMALGALSTL